MCKGISNKNEKKLKQYLSKQQKPKQAAAQVRPVKKS